MAKHDRAKQEKNRRNAAYAERFKQTRCRKCGHRSIHLPPCVICLRERAEEAAA